MSIEDRLTRTKLKQQESIIESGYVECGKALATIRDEKLYAADYRSFEAYVKERWEYSKQQAYRLIEASEVVQSLIDSSPIGDELLLPKNEAQARELVSVPVENRVEVLKKAAESAAEEDRPMIAEDIRLAIEDIVDDDPDETLELKPKEKPLAIENGKLIRSIVNLINEARRALDAIENAPGLEELCSARRSIDRELESTKASLTNCIPHSICPRCNGKRCAQCGNLGWCNAQLIKELAS